MRNSKNEIQKLTSHMNDTSTYVQGNSVSTGETSGVLVDPRANLMGLKAHIYIQENVYTRKVVPTSEEIFMNLVFLVQS
jgi:hypothetical protein